jgi:23S rRNA pseudouridine1911/1915/1917 synthase
MSLDKKFTVEDRDAHQRLDVFLSGQGLGLSRSRIQELIARKKVSVNEEFFKASHKLNPGDIILVSVPGKAVEIRAEKIPLDILYEDEDVLVVNKSAGMVVHPVSLSHGGTLVNALLAHTDRLSTINGLLRPGIVHRLDKDTSGALIVTKTDRSYLHIARQIRRREVKRRYKALVLGKVEPEEGRIAAPIGRHAVSRQKMSVRYVGGREAITNYKVVEKFVVRGLFFSLLEVLLETGRTHQIRVHLASIGHPVAGDAAYGRKSEYICIKRQALHAELIGFVHPVREEYIEFVAPLPEDIVKQIEELRKLM